MNLEISHNQHKQTIESSAVSLKNFTNICIRCIIYCHATSASTLECANFVPRIFDEKFPKTFLCKRRGCSAEGAANGGHSGRIIAGPAAIPYLRYNILYHAEYLYVFTLKLLLIRCPFASELTRPIHCPARSATNSSRVPYYYRLKIRERFHR